MTYRSSCCSRSRGIHSYSARNNSESNYPTIQTTTPLQSQSHLPSAITDMAPGPLPANTTHVTIGRISPSPSRAFTPPYSHSLNSISSITPLTTRTFTLSSSRSLKNLKIHTLIPPDSHPSNLYPPQNPTTPASSQLPTNRPQGGGTTRGFIHNPTDKTNTPPPQRPQGGGYHKGILPP